MRTSLFPLIGLVACAGPAPTASPDPVDPSIDDSGTPTGDSGTTTPVDAGYDLTGLQPIAACDSVIALAEVDDLIVIFTLDVPHPDLDAALYACQPIELSSALSIYAVVDALTYGAPCASVEERSYGPGPSWYATSGEVSAVLTPFAPAWADPVGTCYPGNAMVPCGTLELVIEDVELQSSGGGFLPLTAPRIELSIPYHTPDVPA